MIQPVGMSETRPEEEKKAVAPEIKHPKGSEVSSVWRAPNGSELSPQCRGEWTVLRESEKPVAEMFHTSYVAKDAVNRPIAFVFNGGPGAASAYLQVGAVGPRRVEFTKDGNLLPPPTPEPFVDDAHPKEVKA